MNVQHPVTRIYHHENQMDVPGEAKISASEALALLQVRRSHPPTPLLV